MCQQFLKAYENTLKAIWVHDERKNNRFWKRTEKCTLDHLHVQYQFQYQFFFLQVHMWNIQGASCEKREGDPKPQKAIYSRL